jgi:hypothetical protein
MTKARTNADNYAADITGVTAGTGITGGGTSGTVTVTNELVTTIDAAGDLLYGTGSDAAGRLAIGTANQVLAVNSGATAPEWVTASAGGMTVIDSGSLSTVAQDTTLTSIPATFNHLQLVIFNFRGASNNRAINLRINGNAGASQYSTITTYGQAGSAAFGSNGWSNATPTGTSSTTSYSNSVTTFWNYAQSGVYKIAENCGFSTNGDNTATFNQSVNAYVSAETDAISSITMRCSDGNAAAGTYILYGVK